MTKIIDNWAEKAGILIEAMPYMRRYSGQSIVVKFGGHAMGEQAYVDSFAADMALLRLVGAQPVVVHGGGPQIGDMLGRLNIESSFVGGLRVTDAATISIVEMVLCGAVGKSLVTAINKAGGRALGLSGKDGRLMSARKLEGRPSGSHSQIEKIDLGFVGTPDHIDATAIEALMKAGMIPVIAPIAADEDGQTYNINADMAAGAIASAVGARRLLMLTDVEGVKDKNRQKISKLTASEAEALIKDGTVKSGMIPKIETCIKALKTGAQAAVILDGRTPHAVLVELFTERGIGTLITHDD